MKCEDYYCCCGMRKKQNQQKPYGAIATIMTDSSVWGTAKDKYV